MSHRDEYLTKMEAQLEEWNVKIDKMQARAKKAAAEGKSELQKQLEAADAKRNEVNRRLRELRAASEDSFAALRSGFEAAWKELTSAFEKTRS